MTESAEAQEAAELEERIAILTELRAFGGPNEDIPGITGALGETLLLKYANEPDEQALATGLSYLSEAAETAPEHEDRLGWWFWLGIGYGEIAGLQRSGDDYDRALRWTSRLIDELPLDHEERDSTVLNWMELNWDRFWLKVCADVELADTEALREADHLLGALGRYRISIRDSEAGYHAQMFVGLGHLARYDLTDLRADLDAGIGAIAGTIPKVPQDEGRLPLAQAMLTKAYQLRRDLDGDDRDLDLAILTGEAGIRPIDADWPAWGLLHWYLAHAYKSRWQLGHDPADLDRSIECWQIRHAEDQDVYCAAQCGDLLRERSVLTNDLDDIAGAVSLLELVTRTPPDHDDSWEPWYDLGRAYQRQAELLNMPGRLDDAIHSFDRALELGAPNDNVLFTLHNSRLSVLCDGLEKMANKASLVATIRSRQLIADATAAFERPNSASTFVHALLAGSLARGLMLVAGYHGSLIDNAYMLRLIESARRLPDAPQEWLAALDVMAGVTQYAADIMEVDGSGEAGFALLTNVLTRSDLDESMRATLVELLPVLLQGRTERSGDLRGQRTAIEMISNTAEASPSADPEVVIIGMIFDAMDCGKRMELDRFGTLTRQIEERVAALPPSILFQRSIVPLVNLMRQLCSLIDQNASTPADLDLPALPDPDPAMDLMSTAIRSTTQLIQAIRMLDGARLREYGKHMDELAARALPGSVIRLGICILAGQAWLVAARLNPTDKTAAQQAARWYEEAIQTAGGPQHGQWTIFALGLGESLRLIPDSDRGRTRDLGRSALHGHRLKVLLQSGTDYAMQAARAAASDAARVAGWCLADGAHDEVLSVLDAGRGLVLQAATASRTIAQVLADEGHAELAAEWQATSGLGRNRLTGAVLGESNGATEIADDLRSRVVQVLDGSWSESLRNSMFDGVSVSDVQRALTAFGADALVYLIPSTLDMPGTALIVPAAGAVDPIPMPGLDVGAGMPIHRWVDFSTAVRDLHPVSSSAHPQISFTLDDMCQWAWAACVGQLVEHVRRWNLNRPARLVLVPMGMLGLIPWHAAYVATNDGRRRYAIDDLVFSYTVSAKTLCVTANHPIRPITSALVVGDPEGSLTFAGLEASAVHRSFYARGTYLGYSNDPAVAATPARVSDWIATASGSALLHLACHAGVDARHPADAHLVLAGGEKLAARALVEASRVAALSIDQVFLAACTTNAIGADYDEVFSLATAFLAAGAHTVFGSMWRVPDTETSLLMYMVHHYLNVDACPPMDALHRAQRWMLDPDRKPPAGMPDELASRCGGEAPSHPVAWAGFTHLGR